MSDSNSPEKKNPKEQEVERDPAQDSEETSLKLSDDTDSQDDKSNTSSLSDSSSTGSSADATADSTENGEQSADAESGDGNGDSNGNDLAKDRPPVTAEQMADIDRRDPEITAMKELLDRVREDAPATLTDELNPDGRRKRTTTTLHGADGNRVEHVSNHPQFGQIKQTQFISGKDEGKVLTEFENHPAIASIEYDSSAPDKAPVINWREGAAPENNTEIPPIIDGKDALGQPWQLRADGNLERYLSGEPAKVVQYTPFDGAGREQSRHFSDRVETVYKDRLEVSYNDPSSHDGLARVIQNEDGSIRKEYADGREDGLQSELISSDEAGRIKERTYSGRADGLLTETEHIGAESSEVQRIFQDRAAILESLKQFADVNAEGVTQRNHELAVLAAANLGGAEALKEMGFEPSETRRGFSVSSANGTRFEFENSDKNGLQLSAIRNRPDGGVFVNHWNDDGSLAKSYEQVFDGDQRTDYMRDAEGDVTEIRRPDGSTVNISYEGESEDGSKIATAIRDSNGHELRSEDGKIWRNTLDSKAESFEAQLSTIEGGGVRLSGSTRDLILGTDGATTEIDKVSGLATRTELDGTSVTRDTTGEVVSTVNRQGERSTYSRDQDGELKAFVDAEGAWRKDAEGTWHNERTGETDNKERFVDNEGRLHTKDSDGAGTIKQLDGSLLTVDSKQRITEILSANKLRTRFEYKGDDPRPTGIRYNNSDKLWVATDQARSQWKEVKLEGEKRVATGRDWQGTIEATAEGHRETNALSGTSIERNSDGSITTRNRDNDITRLRTARGDVYNFKYSRQHQLSYVEKPDGSSASSGGEHGWYTNKGRPIGGARVNQETGAYTEYRDDLSATTVRADGGLFEYDKYKNLNSVDLGGGRTARYERDETRAITTGEVIDGAGNKTVSVADGSREIDTADGRHLAYDSAGLLASVERPDHSTVSVERGEDGTIERLVDSKSAIAFQRQPDGSYLQEGSQPPDLIENAEAFFNEDGTYGFRNSEREILKTAEGFRITADGTTTELLESGAMRRTGADGRIEGATSATGLDWSFERSGSAGDTVNRVRVGDRVWTREGDEASSWKSNDGRSFKGEIESDADGNLRFIDAETKFETIQKLDGSTVFRDADGRVHQVTNPDGGVTRYAYNNQGGLARIEMPDGTVFNRLNDRKVKDGQTEKSIERWVEAGTTDVREGSRSVDNDGDLVYRSTTGEVTTEQTDGWKKVVSARGETTYSKEADNGSSVTKNAMGQIVRTINAAGRLTRYGYDEAGHMNSVRLPGGESYSSQDGGKTWDHKVVRGRERTTESGPGTASVTADGSFVFRSFEPEPEAGTGGTEVKHSKEVIHKSDGSVLVARDGRFTTVTPPDSEPIGIGYDAQGKANILTLPGESGQWRSEDGEHWAKYDAAGNLDSATEPRTFKLDVGADGSIRRIHNAETPPYTEILHTDGGSLSFNEAGQKLQETRVESYRGGKPQFSTTEYHYDGENGREGSLGSLESYKRTEADGSTFNYDNLGRLTRMESGSLYTAGGARRPRQVREFEYVGDTNTISAVVRNGERFDLDRESLTKGTPVYKHDKEMLVGRLEARDDGTLVNYRADGAIVYDNLDGSSLTQLGDGSIMKNRYDGLLEERVRADGIKESYRYNLSSSNHVLGRRNEISSMTYHYPDGRVNHWTTANGFDWKRREDGKVWHGFEHIDHKTGRRIERPMSGRTYENRLDGSREEIRYMNIEARTKEIEKTFDYWTQRGKIADIRSQLRELDADETYMVRHQFNAKDRNALADALDEELGGHRLTEATGYLKRSETLGYDEASSNQGENYAIQLEVDAQEMDRWWWNRDRSKEEILTSTRHILGSASEAERLSIDAAYGRMFTTGNAEGEVGQNNLARFYGEGGAGYEIANWDSYHRTLISIAAETGADKRSPEQQAQIISSALDSAYGNRLDYMSEASSRAFSNQEGRDYFLAHGGEAQIRQAFTQEHYTEDGSSYTTTDGWSIEQATDYARLGELRPITEFKKAFGVFSNDQKAMEHALSRLSDEQRALLADGKQLFDDGVMPQTDGQKEALAYYKSWHKAFRDAHWFSEEAKATGYEDQALRQGGTGINRDIAPIGTHWTNSHEINATAIEDMSLATFNLLTQGIGDNDAGAPSSPYYEQMQDALAKNLGAGDYQDRATALLAEKMKSADALIEAADTGNTDYLRDNVPALKDIPQDQWQKLSGGYALEESLRTGEAREENLSAEQAEMLTAYRGDNNLRAFIEGREVARHLNEVDTGEALGRYIQGKELDRKIKNGELEESGLSEADKESLRYFTEYGSDGDILEDNDLSLANSAIIEMRAKFFQERGDASKTALETYQKMLYESVRANVRRDVVDAIKDNDHTFSDDHGAMLDAISEMTDAEIDRYRDPNDSYKQELDQLLAERMGGENSTAYKAAQIILGQMEKGDWNPSTNPEQSLTFDLLKQRLDKGYLSQADAARTIQKALGANESLQQQLAQNPAFAEAATLALSGEAGFDKIVKPLLEDGHLPVSTLVELNTRIISDGEGGTHEEFLQDDFLEDAILNATPQSLAYLASDAGESDREKILAKLSPDRKEIVEAVLANRSSDASRILEGEGAVVAPRVDPEDRIRAAIVTGKDLDDIKDILSGLDEKNRSMAIQDYQLKYGSQLRADLFERASSSQRSEFEYLTRTAEWSTEQSHLFNIDRVASTDAGIGGSLSRNWNMMHRMALTDFEVARLETEGHIEPERMRELNEAIDHAVEAFRETKEATAETVVNGIITAGALAAAPFTGGTSLGALFATGGVIVGGGIIGAGGKYLLMGNDHEGMRTLAGDFVKFSALTAANVIGAEHLALVGGLGRKAALSATERALADAAFQGLSREVKDEVAKGMMQLVRDGIAHGGGVADDAIVQMLGKVKGLDDVARAQLASGLQTSLREAVDQTARTGLRQVLKKAQDEATSMGLISLSGAAGNVIGDSANMLITRGEIDSDQLLLSGTMGGTFAFGFGGVFKLGGSAYSRLLSRSAPDAPHVPLSEPHVAGPDTPHMPVPDVHAGTGDNVIPFQTHTQTPDRLAARLPETPGHLENTALSSSAAEAADVYKPRIEAPDAAKVERLSQEVPELNAAVADDFGKRMTEVRESWGEDLSEELNLARELAPRVDEARARLDQEIARLEAAGHSPEAIQEALTSKKHPLHKDSELKQLHTEWKGLADQHAGKTRKIEELAQMRRDQLQTELDRFVAEHNLANSDKPLPPVKIELANNMAAAGGYSFGEGVVVLPRAELIKASGGQDLSRAVFHEVVHSQQDMDIIRTLAAEQLSHADGGGVNSQLLKEAYKDATGRDLNENWMRTVLDTANDAPPLSAVRQQRAIVLADEVARTGPVAELSRDLTDTASHIHNRLARLSDGARNANWNEFMADLARPGSGEEMARRLFGEGGYDAMPENLQTALAQWQALPKNSKGLPNNFKLEPELKDSVVAHLKSRLDTVNTRHRQLIDAYAGSRLETEAYGFDSNVSQGLKEVESDISRLPPPREYPLDRVEAPDQFRTDEIARLEQESASFSYAVDVRYGLMPNENTPFADIAQGEIFKQIQNHVLTRPGLDGGPSLADQGWTVLQSQKFSAADQAGGDYILLNRKTGEYHILDATERPDKRNNLVERIIWNRKQFESGTLNRSGVDLVADRIAEITAQKPILNVVDHPLPSLQRPADLIDGREQLRQWQTALRESDNNAISNFANQDLEGVIKYYHHKLRESSIEYKTELQAFQASGDRSVRDAILEYYGVNGSTGRNGGFNNQTPSGSNGPIKVTHNEISMTIGTDRYTARVTAEQIQELEKEAFGLALEASRSLPAAERAAVQDRLYTLRQGLSEDSVRNRAATLLSEQDPGKLLGKELTPKPTPSRVRYSQEEVNALYAASGAWNELRDSLPGTRLGDDFDEYVHLALEDLRTSWSDGCRQRSCQTPGRLSTAEIDQFERMIAEYRAGDQDAVRLTHEMLDLPYQRPADFTSINRSHRPGEPLSHMRHSANLDVYEPLTPPVAPEQTAALERAIPALDREGAQEMVDLMATWKNADRSGGGGGGGSIADDLRPAHEQVLELHNQVEQTRQLYSNIVEDLKARGVSVDDIKEASRRSNHALNEDYGIYQARQNMQKAVDLHVRANLRLGQKVGERVNELQKALDQFTESRGLPPVKVTTKKPNGNLGDYSSGEGTILIDETAFLEPGGDKLLPRVLFHELVHHEQDTLLVRKAIQDAGLNGKEIDFDNMELVRARYEEATGIDARALDQDFIARVADTYKNAGDLNPEQLARAQKLAEDARAYRFEIDQVMELGNTARVLSSTGRSLLRSTDSAAVNKLFQRLDGDEGNIHMRRMFGNVDGEPIPKEIEAKLAEWRSLPRDENGLAVGFEEGDIRSHLIAHIEHRLDRVNAEHKQLVDSYFDNGLEREAYGLDHLIVNAERQQFGDDYHQSFEPRDRSRATTDLEGVDSSNLARNLDSAYRYERSDLAGYNLRFGENGEPQMLDGTTIKLGRGEDMQVKIGSDFVSREHAQIFLDGNGKPHIMNLSNTNHTFVNGVPVEIYTPLKPGDVIGLGFYRNNEFFGQQLTFGDNFNSAMPLEKGLGQYQIYSPQGDVVMDFTSNKVTLGRSGQNADMEFPADTISARHAEIEITPEGPLLRDTNSRNGTYVNGERITERILKPGDRVKLSEQFEFVFGKKVLGELENFKLSLPESGLNLEFPQGAKRIVVGRGHDADVKLVDDGHLDVAGISRRHAEFRYEDGKIIVEDLGSKNGTYVNGRRIEEPTELKPGDAVRFGQGSTSEFLFEANGAVRVREPENIKIEGTDFNRGDRVRLDNPRYADYDAVVAGKDPDSDQLIVVVHNDYQRQIKVLPDSNAARMKPVDVNGQTLLKDEHNIFYQRFRLDDGKYTLISRPDVQLFSRDAVREAFAQIDYRVGQFIENPSSPDITGEVLAYDNTSGDPIVRLKQSARANTKKNYEANSSYDPESGTVKIGDQELKPIDVEGQKYYHDGQGNVYGADFSPDGKDAFVFKQQSLRIWDRATSFKSALQPRRVEFGPPHIEMPRAFDELPDARAPRGHRDNVLYQNAEFFLRDQPMLVNGKPVNFEGGAEIAVGRELLGIEYDGAGQYVSAEHGKFGWDEDRQLFYFDDHSRNGTFVRRANSSEFVKYNGTIENPRRVYLAPGDELRLGRVDGEKLNLSLSQNWAMKRGTNVEATSNTQVFFDGQRLEMDGNTVDVGRKFQVYGNNNPTDALNRRVARHHAQLEYDESRGQWNITDFSGGSGGVDDQSGSILQTIMVRDQGNGIFIKQGGTDRISFHANETVPLGPNDRVYIGSSRGPELKLVTRQGQPLGDGRVSFQQDNLDWLTTRPDGSHTVRSHSGSSRLVSPDGTVAEATTAAGQRLRFKYDNRELSEIVLPDNSSVVKRGNDTWVRLTPEGKEEPWWKGGLEVENDGSLLYRTTDKPPNMVRQRLDNVVETIDAKGRVSYSDIDYNFERLTLKKYGESLGHPERVERFGQMMEDFEARAKQANMTETQIAESYHQIRRLLQADEGSMLNMTERQKLAEQTLYQMSHPEKVSQGSNNTCNVTTVEKRILQRHPEEFARLVADVATTGKYVTADGTLIDMSRVPGALEPDREARMLDILFRGGSESDIHLDGRRSWASQMFETTAVGIKYARGGSIHGEYIGPGEIVMYQKQVGLPGQEAEQLVKYSVGTDGRLNHKVLEDSPHISTSELADINNQIIGRHEENFVLSGHYFPDSHGNNRFWREQDYSAGALKVARSTEELKDQLLSLQDSNNMPAIALVHTGHSLFGGHGPGTGGAHVVNIQSIRQTPVGTWVVDFTNQWGDAYNKTIPLDEMFKVMNAVE
ncbi:MAG: FHA domain-containing protein [Candidatus Obscuribacterales bacterium]|nr:FHA domain-containing protein [Candidatus Obscuribacterales bacterium]